MTAIRIALLNIRLVMRTKTVLFFTFVFPLVWLFVFEGIFAHGDPKTVMYFFGPVVTLNIMGSAFWGLGLQSVMQRERGILRRYRLAPISAVSIVAANLLANYLLELPTIGLLVLCAKVIFHMPLAFGWGTLFILVTVGTFGFAGFGLTIASIANTMQEAQIYNNLVWVTLLFLSGATIPLPLLPGWIQRIATFLPATYLVTSFQAIMIQSEPILKHWPEMLALVLSGIFGLLFAWKLFRWEKEEKIPNPAKAWALLFILPFLFIGFWMTIYANPTKAWASTYSLLGSGHSNSRKDSQPALQQMFREDFESQKAESEMAARWHVAASPSSNSDLGARLELISSGAEGSGHALRVSGVLRSAVRPAEPRGAVECEMGPFPAGTQAQGVEFWARGDRHIYTLQLLPPEPAAVVPAITWVPSSEWQSVKIPAPGIISQKEPSPSQDWKLEIAVAGEAGKFSFDIDQVGLYGVLPAPQEGAPEKKASSPLR
jgi:ABC-type multidrug transport system permease subunit